MHDRDLGSTGHGTGAAGRDHGKRDPVFVDRREHEAPRRRLENTQVGCAYVRAWPGPAAAFTTWRSIHSQVDDPIASAPTSRMKS